MTKHFEFNWRIPVPDKLLEGCLVDRWTEVSSSLLLYFYFTYLVLPFSPP